MALILPSSSCLLSKKANLLHHTPLFLSPPKPTSPFLVRSQDSSSAEPPKPTTTTQPIDGSSPLPGPPPKIPPSTGLGFGSSSSSSSAKTKSNPVSSTQKKQRARRERDSIIRRRPVEKPGFLPEKEEALGREQMKNESAFLLAWLGLGSVIFIEGIALAASGFLPEKWDQFFVKYLYPSFTPTVFLFVAGTVFYGVFKYLQNEKLNNQK